MASSRADGGSGGHGSLRKGAEQRTGRPRRRMVNALTAGSTQGALRGGRQLRSEERGVAAMARAVVAAGSAAAALVLFAPRVAQWARAARPSHARLTPARALHAAGGTGGTGGSDGGGRGIATRNSGDERLAGRQQEGGEREQGTRAQQGEGAAAGQVAEALEGAGMEGGGGDGPVAAPGPMEMLARGLACIQANLGPWSVSDLTLGLAVMAKVTAKRPPPPPPGGVVAPAALGVAYLAEVQRLRAHAEAVYSGDSAAWSLQTNLPESAIVHAQWHPHNQRVRPAFVVCVDAQLGAVVVAVRGTSDTADMLVNAGTFPHDFLGGKVHSGFLHAATHLLYEAREHIEHALRAWHDMPVRRLVFVGHSLGAAVAILAGMMLRHENQRLQPCTPAPDGTAHGPPSSVRAHTVGGDRNSHAAAMHGGRRGGRGRRREGRQQETGWEDGESEELQEAAAEAVVGAGRGLEGVEVQCVGYGPPACMTLNLARHCTSFVTCVLVHHDLVPRFSLASVELLRQAIGAFDWDRAEAVLGWQDNDWQRLKAARDLLARLKDLQSTAAEAAAAVQGSAVSTAAAVQQSAAGVAVSVQQSALLGAAAGAAGAVQSQAMGAAAAVQGAAVAVTGAAAGLGSKAQEMQHVVAERVPGIVADAIPQGVVELVGGARANCGKGEGNEGQMGRMMSGRDGQPRDAQGMDGQGAEAGFEDGAEEAERGGMKAREEGRSGGKEEERQGEGQRVEAEHLEGGEEAVGSSSARGEGGMNKAEEGGKEVSVRGENCEVQSERGEGNGERSEVTGRAGNFESGGSEGRGGKNEAVGAEQQESGREKQQQEEFAPPLYPPGRLLMLCCDPPGCGHRPTTRKDVHAQRQFGVFPSHDEVAGRRMRWQVVEVQQEAVREIVVSPWCISDHMPGTMGEGLNWIMAHVGGGDDGKVDSRRDSGGAREWEE
ncbi:hypothetical protein CLOM_g7954 [Closterium sp. NIES-68]|nr:hypothetical protein CLOM_g7954 [Closterium sp. NIES-68]GJP86384.1 hypothetical protein CLOP_g16409 [Closterium sp. NIES-67]